MDSRKAAVTHTGLAIPALQNWQRWETNAPELGQVREPQGVRQCQMCWNLSMHLYLWTYLHSLGQLDTGASS